MAPENDPYLDETRHTLEEGHYDVEILDQEDWRTGIRTCSCATFLLRCSSRAAAS
jgi:hypothetical protein